MKRKNLKRTNQKHDNVEKEPYGKEQFRNGHIWQMTNLKRTDLETDNYYFIGKSRSFLYECLFAEVSLSLSLSTNRKVFGRPVNRSRRERLVAGIQFFNIIILIYYIRLFEEINRIVLSFRKVKESNRKGNVWKTKRQFEKEQSGKGHFSKL